MAKICQFAVTTVFAGTMLAHTALTQSDTNMEMIHLPQMKRELPTRKMNIDALQKTEYDVLIIGGGAVGAGCALDAITRGLKTALIEANDFGSGASSKSTKLLHGGVRDLRNSLIRFDIHGVRRVHTMMKERALHMKIAPHLCQNVQIMLPVHHWWETPLHWIHLSLYNLMAPPGTRWPYFISSEQVLHNFPFMRKKNIFGAFVIQEGQHDDARMCLNVALTASRHGADICNHMRVVQLLKTKNYDVCGAVVKDELTGKSYNVRAKCVINAAGPGSDAIRKLDQATSTPMCTPSVGTHIVMPGYYCPEEVGLFDAKTRDGRVLFFLPWQGHTIVGTTDMAADADNEPIPTESEVQYILEGVKDYVNPSFDVRRCDVLSVWSGLRPLPKRIDNYSKKRPEINHVVNISDTNLITIVGGTWTSYRLMAERTINAAIKYCKLQPMRLKCITAYTKLDGAAGWSPHMYIRLVQDFGMEEDVSQHLWNTYGTNAFKVATNASNSGKKWPIIGKRLHSEFPYIEAEVRHGINEYACTIVDVLARRLRLAFLNVQVADEMVPMVANIMSEELGWSYEKKQKEIKDARKFLTTHMGQINYDASKISIPIKMSVKQVQKYASHFRSMDERRTGYVSVNKCCKAMESLGVKDVPIDLMHDVLRDIDAQSQGKVNLYEFLLLMSAVLHGDTAYLRYAKMHLDQQHAQMLEQIPPKRYAIPVERSGGGL